MCGWLGIIPISHSHAMPMMVRHEAQYVEVLMNYQLPQADKTTAACVR